jgi:hypothetical protein
MIKHFLIILAITMICFSARAATFVDVQEHVYKWDYHFSVKSSSLAVSTPLNVWEIDCIAERKTVGPKVPIMPFPTCFDTEAEARVDAQKQADAYEHNLIKNGFSTTVIETKRQIMLLGK